MEKSSLETEKYCPKANLVFLNLYVLALGFGGIQMGFAITGNN